VSGILAVIAGLSAYATAASPAAPRLAYGPDFAVVVPPGFTVTRERGKFGEMLVLRSAAPRQEWTIMRGPSMPDVVTQEGCNRAVDRQLKALARPDAPRKSQAAATPAGYCRYRIVFVSGTELRDWSGSCQVAGDRAARTNRLELVDAGEGTPPARCRASCACGFPLSGSRCVGERWGRARSR